jgi:hypothetical protein
MGDQKWTNQRNWQRRVSKTKKNKTKTQKKKNNLSKTWFLLQTTGGKNEPNIGFYAEIVADITTRNLNVNKR